MTAQPATVFETYAGADHAFDNDDMPWHDPSSSTLAWCEAPSASSGSACPSREPDATRPGTGWARGATGMAQRAAPAVPTSHE